LDTINIIFQNVLGVNRETPGPLAELGTGAEHAEKGTLDPLKMEKCY
jgi:hypothetical protein